MKSYTDLLKVIIRATKTLYQNIESHIILFAFFPLFDNFISILVILPFCLSFPMSLQDQIGTLNANLQGLIQFIRDLGERMDQFSEAAQQMPTKDDLLSIQESIVETNHCLAKIQEEMKNNTYQISNINNSNNLNPVLTTISSPISSPISNSSNKNKKANKKKKEMSEQEKSS